MVQLLRKVCGVTFMSSPDASVQACTIRRNDIPVSGHQSTHTDTHAGHYEHKHEVVFCVRKAISGAVFRSDYPENPQNFGEALRRARMDAGLQIKELASELGVNETSVINWETKGVKPRGWRMEAVRDRFGEVISFA